MPCGCAGSAQQASERHEAAARRTSTPRRVGLSAPGDVRSRTGLPGQPGYTWNGPPKRPTTPTSPRE